METSLLFIAGAAMCGFLLVFALVLTIDHTYRHACLVLQAQGQASSLRSLFRLCLENGITWLLPLSHALMRSSRVTTIVAQAVEVARCKGLKVSRDSVLTLYSAMLLCGGILVLLFTRSVIASLAVIACIIAASIILVSSAFDKQKNRFREDVPAVLELMMTCFGSGFTLLQTFQQIAQEMDGELGKIFTQGAHILETGGSVSEALDLLRERTDISELTFVVAALEVQHQNGGALTSVLSTAAEGVKNELALKQTLRVQTAQAKLSARVVMVMPFVLIAFFSLVSPNFMAPFFASFAGYALFAIAILMELAGIVLVKRSLTIGGLS